MRIIIFFCVVVLVLVLSCGPKNKTIPRVFIFTDINIDAGDPDDRQSLIHLLWYANELIIEGIVPDRWYAGGLEACKMAIDAYSEDFKNFQLHKKGFPEPYLISNKLAEDQSHAKRLFLEAASAEDDPLYVLVWGNMVLFGDILRQDPALAKNIRLITIGTDLMQESHNQYLPKHWEKADHPCSQYNWNGLGRNDIFNNPEFNNLWWLEINWTYEGMFSGEEPSQILDSLIQFGSLGSHMKEVVENQPWAWYFRVGDTPSVLYLIDPENDLNTPTHGSWAGTFLKPFPENRPNYYTDHNGPIVWDYNNPCNTWENHNDMARHAISTLENQRPDMYNQLLKKLRTIYRMNK